jgi:hypothetical protein
VGAGVMEPHFKQQTTHWHCSPMQGRRRVFLWGARSGREQLPPLPASTHYCKDFCMGQPNAAKQCVVTALVSLVLPVNTGVCVGRGGGGGAGPLPPRCGLQPCSLQHVTAMSHYRQCVCSTTCRGAGPRHPVNCCAWQLSTSSGIQNT